MEEGKTVFVLGAGFTKAFFPSAPLLVDDYGIDGLIRKYRDFPAAHRILETERNRNPDNKINIERLMSRLTSIMPYDTRVTSESLLTDVLTELITRLQSRIVKARDSLDRKEQLDQFASFCLKAKADCITFNYDDFLEERISKVSSNTVGEPSWSFEDNYGFPCPPSSELLRILDGGYCFEAPPTNLVLKLHGSLNWRIPLGAGRPTALKSIYCSASWGTPFLQKRRQQLKEVEHQLEPQPLIVTPLLDKRQILTEPVLRVIWERAYTLLRSARDVIFIGYSFPTTDLAAQTLFVDAFCDKPDLRVQVVNWAPKATAQADLKNRYCSILSKDAHAAYHFDGAVEWIKKSLPPVEVLARTEEVE